MNSDFEYMGLGGDHDSRLMNLVDIEQKVGLGQSGSSSDDYDIQILEPEEQNHDEQPLNSEEAHKPQPRWTIKCVVCKKEKENGRRQEGGNACNKCWRFFIKNYDNRANLECMAKAKRNTWGGMAERRLCPGLDYCSSCLFERCERKGLVFSHPIKDCNMCPDVLRGMVNTDDKRPDRCFTCGIYLSLEVGKQKSSRCSICRSVGTVNLLKDRTGLKCEVCENLIIDASQALHNGIVSCHPCAQFFLIGCFRGAPFRCRTGDKDCPVGKGSRGDCNLCLYKKCRSVGMECNFDEDPVQKLRVEIGHIDLSSTDDQLENSAAVKVTRARRNPARSAPSSSIPIQMTSSGTSGDSSSSSVSPKRHRSPEEDDASQSISVAPPTKSKRIMPPPLPQFKISPSIAVFRIPRKTAAAASLPVVSLVNPEAGFQPPPLALRHWSSPNNRFIKSLRPGMERSAECTRVHISRSQPASSQIALPQPKQPDCVVCKRNGGEQWGSICMDCKLFSQDVIESKKELQCPKGLNSGKNCYFENGPLNCPACRYERCRNAVLRMHDTQKNQNENQHGFFNN